MKRQIKVMRPDNKTKACNNEVPVSVNSYPVLFCGRTGSEKTQSVTQANMLIFIFSLTEIK